ncbi:MAG: DUF4251 domain-containing protein [Prevotellaceae bacterium]|jgi:hypothetical protein|nr:DUF4251 domain-containing protein [Prevotellaceae bacterium]
MNKTFIFAAALLGCLALGAEGKAQQTADDAAKVRQLVEQQRYRFVAHDAQPMKGRLILLSWEYDLRVSTDTISAYLPYYGRAYTAPVDPLNIGIKFSSLSFDYSAKPAQNKGWDIRIQTKDTPTHYDLRLYVSTSGSAMLVVYDPNRQSITFHGEVLEQKQEE